MKYNVHTGGPILKRWRYFELFVDDTYRQIKARKNTKKNLGISIAHNCVPKFQRKYLSGLFA
jgi:hypothetical protein